ncbi:type II secretion system F family protein [Halomicrobium salinisoli]|uniref:type II secretion system F family protein n=1 Tax=Halomicrobium salinisoli TaxID=2878391 RepID=UPI001CF04818|nr:type II secretion system F family protein [Halomicrobium salinisoli]
MALDPLGLAPLAVVAAVAVGAALTSVSDGWNRTVTRYARHLFGRYVEPDPERQRQLRAAYVAETYRSYAARTLLYTAVAALAGAVAGVYVFGGVLLAIPTIVDLLMGLPPTMVSALGLWGFELVLSETQTFAIVTAGGIVGGLGTAGTTYGLRWTLPRSRAAERRRGIDEGLARTVAFMYALSRGGVAVPAMMRTLSENRAVYGEGAAEVGVAVREMDLFGRDVITAVRRAARRTPSDRFETFAENLASVLQSGQSLSEFLRQQYERYREEAAERQEEVLELLATVAEAYVTVLVAAVLFLLTILLVFGLTLRDTLPFMRILAYLLIPLANAGFVVYLGQKLDSLGVGGQGTSAILDEYETTTFGRPAADGESAGATSASAAVQADGGATARAEHRRQLRLADRLARVRRVLRSPLATLRWHPDRILYVTVPLALLYVAVRAPAAFATETVNLYRLDDVLIRAALFVLVTYAVVREAYARRLRRIEAATPELLERLASLNEAGMSVVESLRRVRGSDVGVLTPEVERIWADVQTGANVEDALVRFGRRLRTVAVTRVVVLLVNAMRASGKLGPVLRIAAEQARADHRLRRKRRQTMVTYLVVIYVSFLVFLVIIAAVQEVLVPSLPSHVPTPENTGRLAVSGDQFARLGQVDKAAYTLVFFHTALIQAVLSGFVGGQLGEGSLRDGAKHAAIMLGVAYVAFLLLSSPVASVTLDGVDAGEGAVVVDSVSASEGGFLVLYDGDRNGTVLGSSGYLQSGTHRDVRIDVDGGVSTGSTVVAVVHRDTDGDESLTLDGSADAPYPEAGRGDVVEVAVTAE